MRSQSLPVGHKLNLATSERKQTTISRLGAIMGSLRVRLILLVLLALMPVLGIDIYSHVDSRQHQQQEVQTNALHLTKLVSHSQEHLIENTRQLLVLLAQLPQVKAGDGKNCRAVLAEVIAQYPAYVNQGVVDSNGNVVCSAMPLSQPLNLAQKSWFQKTLKNRSFSISDYEVGQITAKSLLIMSYPIIDENQNINAVVFAALDLHWLNDIGNTAQLPANSTFTVLDRNGTILARYPNPEKWLGKSAPEVAIVQTILTKQQEGTFEVVGSDGVKLLYAVAPLTRATEGSNLYVSVGIPKTVAFAESDRTLALNLLWLGMVAMLAITSAWWSSDWLIWRRVKSLLKATKQVVAGNLNARTGLSDTGDEISQLAHGFDMMAESLQQAMRQHKWAEATLREREKRYRLVVHSLKEVLFQTDEIGVWTFLNPAWRQITGFAIADTIGTQLLDYVHPDDRDHISAKFQALISQGIDYCSCEARYRTLDGSDRWLEVHARLIVDLQGRILGTSGTLSDITKRKIAQAERDNLFEQLKQEREDLAALSTVTANAISTLNLEELLNVLLQRIVEVTRADVAVILLLEEDGMSMLFSSPPTLRVRASIGIEPELLPKFTVPIGQGFAGIIAATMQPLYLEDAQIDPRIINPAIRASGVRTILGVPLKRQGKLVGVLHVDWCSVRPQSDRDIHLLEITAERCTMAILNAQLYEKTKQLQEQLQLQFDRMPIGCVLNDQDFRCIDWNPAAEKIFGFTKADVLGKNLPDLIIPPKAQPYVDVILQRLAAGDMKAHCVNENITKDGRTIICQWYNTPLKQADGSVAGYLSMVEDITIRKQAEAQLRQRTFYDALTLLPNRVLFVELLQNAISQQLNQPQRLFAVLLLDLERFQIVKYSLGHQVAEQLLVAVAHKLKTCLRPQDTIARLGSDEFAILLPHIGDIDEAISVCDRIHAEMKSPVDLDGCEVFTTTSIGMVASTLNYQNPEDFLQAADTALHQAKRLGKSGTAVFHPSMYYGAVERLQLESDLLRAIEHQQFKVYYQPVVSIVTRKIVGFEALVRWQHPTKGLISPLEFIPLAEDTGLISWIDRWVLRQACRQLSIWQTRFSLSQPLMMSVNLSGLQLSQIGLIERIDRILQETGIKGQNLKLEITESVMMQDTGIEIKMLEQLKTLGIQLLIDDFGTGYSSLARLQQLPIDTLKIDRSFVERIAVDSSSLEIVRTIINLAHRLNMDVIVEGVETSQQLAQLESLQCEYGQGYFFSQPVDSETAFKMIKEYC